MAVAFDTCAAALAREKDVVIVDTADDSTRPT